MKKVDDINCLREIFILTFSKVLSTVFFRPEEIEASASVTQHVLNADFENFTQMHHSVCTCTNAPVSFSCGTRDATEATGTSEKP